MRNVRRVLAVGALVSLAFVAAPPVTAQPSTDDAETPTVTSVIGSADGLFVEVVLEDGSPASFGPEPSVTLPPEGGSVSDELVDLVVNDVQTSAELVSVAAEGELGPDGFATAEVTVLEWGQGRPGTGADATTATCEADLDGVSGTTTLVNAQVLGEDLSEEPEPNTPIGPIDLGDGFEISGMLNGQVENPDGSLSVTPLFAQLTDSGHVILTIQIGPVTCGVVEGEPEPEPAEPVVVTPVFTG
jgi:hypothetical protein